MYKIRIKLLLLSLSLLFWSNISFADGKFYIVHEKVPPEIPYQRALLMYDDKYETLILQSKYQIHESEKTEFIGWVVPVPSVPELASMDAKYAYQLFYQLNLSSQPDVIFLSERIAVALFVTSLLALLICVISSFIPKRTFIKRHHMKITAFSALFFIFSFFYMLSTILGGRSLEKAAGVDILKEEKVGIYDIKVIKSEKSADIIHWLNQNKFKFDSSDAEAFDSYINKDWCFVVAKIDPSISIDNKKMSLQGLVAPLILRFRTEIPIYPLALTATIGHDTEVLIYTLSKRKLESDNRLRLFYAGETSLTTEMTEIIQENVEPQDFFLESNLVLPFLCKFKETLTPVQMREDITFQFAKNNEEFGRKIYKW
jgi:hypothetical protein